ncbi:hypothetical protein HYV22_01190 [Candidatus Gottesmanbacteria bacterium]|nr:hypothetical protein [Candidatus Gottesmanbacteria bacterium]
MLAIAHALVGGAIAKTIPDPATGILLSLTSHFIMDSIPHWDVGTNWRKRQKYVTGIVAILDTVIGITLAYLVFQGKVATGYLSLAIIASLLPDWLETPWYIFFANAQKQKPAARAGFLEKLCFRIYKGESAFHHKTEFPLGLMTQLVTLAFFFLLLSSPG